MTIGSSTSRGELAAEGVVHVMQLAGDELRRQERQHVRAYRLYRHFRDPRGKA